MPIRRLLAVIAMAATLGHATGCAQPRSTSGTAAIATVAVPPDTGPLPNGIYAVAEEGAHDAGEPLRVLPHDARSVSLRTSSYVPLILETPPELEDGGNGHPLLRVTLASRYVKALEDFTRAQLGGHAAIVVGSEIVSVHKVRSVVAGGKMEITRCSDSACETIRSKLQ